MISDLHVHSLLSDGALIPSEVAARYAAAGYDCIAICDHADYSNIDRVVSAIRRFAGQWPKEAKLRVLPGVELTHLPLSQFAPLSRYARKNGMKIIIGHGQTPVEPVTKGTNRAALEADIDILAHPGYLTDEEALLAKKKKIFLEITARKGHCTTNSFVLKKALAHGSPLVINTDSHAPCDILAPRALRAVGLRAGLTPAQLASLSAGVGKFLGRLLTT